MTNKLQKIFGFILGGSSGSIAGFQMGTFFGGTNLNKVLFLSFFLSLFFGFIGAIIGFVLRASISTD